MYYTIQLILLFIVSTMICAPNTSNKFNITNQTKETVKEAITEKEVKEKPADESKVYWDAKQKLNWRDFQSPPSQNGHLDAYSTLGMSYVVLHNTDKVIEMGVYGYFEKDKSWVKPGEKTDHLLNHEQSHFDLCELYRRILKKRFAAFGNYTYANVNREMKRIFQEVFDEYDQIQQRYDRETNHSLVKLKQVQWDEYIKKQIADHNEFAGDFVTLNIRAK